MRKRIVFDAHLFLDGNRTGRYGVLPRLFDLDGGVRHWVVDAVCDTTKPHLQAAYYVNLNERQS